LFLIITYIVFIFSPGNIIVENIFTGLLYITLIIYFLSFIINNIFIKLLHKNIYGIKFLKQNIISTHLERKLENGSLKIDDIIEKFTIDGFINNFDYQLNIKLNVYMDTYFGIGKGTEKETLALYGIELFNYQGSNEFEFSKCKLLCNDYKGINSLILPNFETGLVNGINKIYYELSVNFYSSSLPHFRKNIPINFNNKLLFKSYDKLIMKLIIYLILLPIVIIVLLSLLNIII
ncbi:MAG: hypothetical protein GY828_05990, partial [Candidatus Gracilibacteria bacterium]|nr:hypothetical protein [Candidatus Gracilibacteria bacterium]